MPRATGDMCAYLCACLCAIMPKGGCWDEDRPNTMFPFEMEKDREGEMKGNRELERGCEYFWVMCAALFTRFC